MVIRCVLSMLGICVGSYFIAELKSHYEEFEIDPWFTLQPAAMVVLVSMKLYYVLQLQGTVPKNKWGYGM